MIRINYLTNKMRNKNTPTLARFELPTPYTCGEHAECSHLLSFLEQYVDEVLLGKTSVYELKCDLELARCELEDTLGDCLDKYNEQNPF